MDNLEHDVDDGADPKKTTYQLVFVKPLALLAKHKAVDKVT